MSLCRRVRTELDRLVLGGVLYGLLGRSLFLAGAALFLGLAAVSRALWRPVVRTT